MLSRTHHTLRAWLCLAAALLMGVAPAQGLMLCLEPDGSIELESTANGGQCDGCTSQPAGEHPAEHSFFQVHQGCCPCIDVLLPAAGAEPRLAASAEQRVDNVVLGLPAVERALPIRVSEVRVVPRSDAPRPAQLLALIRSVVLHV